MTWVKLPAWDGTIHHGCRKCSHTEEVADLEMTVAVGFGSASVTKDGAVVWMEDTGDEEQVCYELAHFEQMALDDPDHDWRAVFYGPLRGMTYQRHEPGKWVLVESNEGFA